MTTQDFINKMEENKYCNGDSHMAIYITSDGKVIDGFKRLKAASVTNHPVLVKVVPNHFTRVHVDLLLNSQPTTCTCSNAELITK